ncbi:hypothetical protein ARHIZOSPH14_26700 [Agromyces rhizosphaerae]|uniref:General stress protein 17M-like domain-containing protein n=2 Tax=Agromyces rhizosphaerae TaxID=88374 RepID=A0A9W6FSR2_9MICO|nr:hypothetical protein ARHIZOSPH14_26700 [Agromyces rhizosphaerae]
MLGGRGTKFPTVPKGDEAASFETYAEAQAAVDTLARADFPVKQLSIVGTDLTSIERVTGRMSYGRAAGAGALSGLWFGMFLGLLFFIVTPNDQAFGVLFAALLLGAGFGMLFGLVTYTINRRRRDFTSVMQVAAGRYALIVEPGLGARARELLGTDASPAPSPAAPTSAPRTYEQATTAREASEPGERAPRPRPQYGELAEPEDETAPGADATDATGAEGSDEPAARDGRA